MNQPNRKAVRILTYHYLRNNGAFLYAFSLCRNLTELLPGCDVKILDYRAPSLRYYDLAKIVKLQPGSPLFYLRRHLLFEKAIGAHLPLDTSVPNHASHKRMMDWLQARRYHGLIVAMDSWNVRRSLHLPSFPNPYWLDESITANKIAFSVSAFNSDPGLLRVHRDTIRRILNSYRIIGARDDFTFTLLRELGLDDCVHVERTYDPTLEYPIDHTDIDQKLAHLGVDSARPTLGLMLHGKPELCQTLREFYADRGYQILGVGMYNPHADINLGDKLNPFEWASALSRLSLCITDRFHGTLFCLKNDTPVVCIEPKPIAREQSKLYCLLSDFGTENLYMDDTLQTSGPSRLAEAMLEVQGAWDSVYSAHISAKIEEMVRKNKEFGLGVARSLQTES